jgi:hypothetical protein
MKRASLVLSLGLGLLVACSSSYAADGVALKEQFANVPYFPKEQLPVKKVAISAMNLKLGVHLERLTLLSGEGNTEKKVMSGLLAGAATLLGGGGGIDFADKEPIEDHLPSADAQKIADDIGRLLAEAVSGSGLEMVPVETVTAAPGYAAAEGETKITTDTENIKGSLFKPSYFFGYQQVPVMGYKFRKKPSLFFGMPTDNASARVREIAGVPLTLAWTVSIVNDRKVMRVRELTLNCFGLTSASGSTGDDKLWASVSIEPDTISTSSGESHKNLEYWSTMAPKFSDAAKAMAKTVADKFAVAGN